MAVASVSRLLPRVARTAPRSAVVLSQRCGSTDSQALARRRNVEHVIPHGPGGRSSVSGLTVTVFGSTGFLGRYVVNRYGKIGSQVVIPYRGDEHDYRHLKVAGDLGQIIPSFYSLRDYDAVRRLVEHSDIVVNLVSRDYETSNFSFEDVNIAGAATIARACQETGVARLVHVSAAGATQESPSRFLKTKAMGEAAVRAEYPAATIVRPSWMFGHEDRFFNRIAFMHTMPTIPGDPIQNQGETTYHPVYVADVADGIVRASRTTDSAGQTYEFAGPDKWSYMQLLNYFGQITRRPIRPMAYPTFVIKYAEMRHRMARAPGKRSESGFRINRAEDASLYTAGERRLLSSAWARALEILPPSPKICREDLLRGPEGLFDCRRGACITPGRVAIKPKQLRLDEVLEGRPGLSSLGIAPTKLESIAISFLRRYRSGAYYDAPADLDTAQAMPTEEARVHSERDQRQAA